MLSLIHATDAMGVPAAIIRPSTCRYALKLMAGTGRTLPVPAGARTVLVNATGPVWVTYGGPAALPADDDLGGNAPELNPAGRSLEGIQELGLVSSGDCLVSLCFFG